MSSRIAIAVATLTLSGALSSVAHASPPLIESVPGREGELTVAVTADPDSTVRIVERLKKGDQELASFVSNGTKTVVSAGPWLCSRKSRQLLAVGGPQEGPSETSAPLTVQTGDCKGRVRLQTSKTVRPGSSIRLKASDRWPGARTGKLCVRPPGGMKKCRKIKLEGGSTSTSEQIKALRPGRWTVSLTVGDSPAAARTVSVRRKNGALRLFAGGDSEMQMVDSFIAAALRKKRVRVRSDARISTGLTNTFFFDWLSHARQVASSQRPDISVMFIGANDGFPLPYKGKNVPCCGSSWKSALAQRVSSMMSAYLRGGRGRVYWYLLPAPRGGDLARYFRGVNAGVTMAAKRHKGEVKLLDLRPIFSPGGRFRQTITYRGKTINARESDGYHLSVAGNRIAASMLVKALREDGLIGR